VDRRKTVRFVRTTTADEQSDGHDDHAIPNKGAVQAPVDEKQGQARQWEKD
jgi:hypothetical protein